MVDGLIYIVLYYSYLDTGAGDQATTKLLGGGDLVNFRKLKLASTWSKRPLEIFKSLNIIIL